MKSLRATTAAAVLVVTQLLSLCDPGEPVRCSVCETWTANQRSSCLTHPPSPRECEGMDFCINVAQYTQTGNLKSFTRSCSPFMQPPACVPGIDRASGELVQLCYRTCATSGCNGSGSLHHLLNLLRRRRK